MKVWAILLISLFAIGLLGCSAVLDETPFAEMFAEDDDVEVSAEAPEATLNPVFLHKESATRIAVTRTPPPEATTSTLYVDLVATEVQMTEEAPPLPTPTNTPLPTPVPTVGLETYELVYEDELSANWEIVTNAQYEVIHGRNPYSGNASIIFTPTLGARTFMFTVKESADRTYRQDEIFGITFQVSSINNHIGIDDMAMTVIGSNEIPYWKLDDFSVENVGIPNENWVGREDRISNWYATIYPETLFAFLEVDRAIAPKTWTPVNNWLSARLLAPPYEYVTGFYVKTGNLFQGTVQIDDIRIIALEQ
ncbi:MAG: hypothetical protein ACPG8W_11240 [Candidatus Promineifilaceae bacterium]